MTKTVHRDKQNSTGPEAFLPQKRNVGQQDLRGHQQL